MGVFKPFNAMNEISCLKPTLLSVKLFMLVLVTVNKTRN